MLGNQLKKLSTSSLAGLQTQAFNSSPYLHTLSMQRETFSGEHDAGLVSFFYFLTEAQLIYSISGIQQSDSVIYNICIHVYFFRFFFPLGFPGGSDAKNLPECGRPGLEPRVGTIPWRRAWQPTPIFLAGESPWTEEPGGLQSMGSQSQT